MKNIKLLSQILKRRDKLIISNEFKEAYRTIEFYAVLLQ